MNLRQVLNHVVVRNGLGLLALLAVYYVSDQYYLDQRPGFNQLAPYCFAVLLYGWLVVHNRVLFEQLYQRDRKWAYLSWTVLVMGASSLNMHIILRTYFNVAHTLPHLVSFWVYTIAGLGIYVLYRHQRPSGYVAEPPARRSPPSLPAESAYFECMVDGDKQSIPCVDIVYVESLENYVKVTTSTKVYLTRLTLKEAEERLPKPAFIRISRSHIVKTSRIDAMGQDTVKIGAQELRIGKVYKRYVAEYLAGIR